MVCELLKHKIIVGIQQDYRSGVYLKHRNAHIPVTLQVGLFWFDALSGHGYSQLPIAG